MTTNPANSAGLPGRTGIHALRGPLAILLVLFCTAVLAVDPMPFRDAQEEARFRDLAAELRCVMCQNQSLADSDAPIAKDLRREVLDLMQAGKTDDEIKTFLTERYTDFVLYRPAMQGSTLWIWLMPPAILFIGALVVFLVVRRRSSALASPAKTPKAVEGDEWQ